MPAHQHRAAKQSIDNARRLRIKSNATTAQNRHSKKLTEKMNQKHYLARIEYHGPLKPNLALLAALQKAHLFHVPFENLDIHLNRPITLDLQTLYKKIVIDRRGGFCYELNGLFYQLLKNIGFEVKRVSARVYVKDGGLGPECDHMAIIARIEKTDYLVDVGFGEFAVAPLIIHTEGIQQDERGAFKLDTLDAACYKVSKQTGDKWQPEYAVSLRPRALHEFDAMCQHHQSSPDSHFTQNKLCSLATQEGRITLSDQTFKTKTQDKIEEWHVNNNTEFFAYLRQYFAIDIQP